MLASTPLLLTGEQMTPTELKSRLSELAEKRNTCSDKFKFAIREIREEVKKQDGNILAWGCKKGYSFQDYDWKVSGIRFGDSVEYTFYQVLGEAAIGIYSKIHIYRSVEEDYYEVKNCLTELEVTFAKELDEFVKSLERWEDPEVLLGFCSLFVTDLPSGTGASVPIQDFITWLEERK